MIRRVDVALRTELAAAPIDRSMALFEAAMMARCAASPTQISGRSRASTRALAAVEERAEPGVLIEFTSSAAARRYAAAVAPLIPEAEVRGHQLGWRHQYEVHQVTVPSRLEPLVSNRLRRAWQAAAELLGDDRRVPAAKRQAVARAAWRAALLVVGPGRGVACLRLRLADLPAVDVLLRAAVVLELLGARGPPAGRLRDLRGWSGRGAAVAGRGWLRVAAARGRRRCERRSRRLPRGLVGAGRRGAALASAGLRMSWTDESEWGLR